MKGSAECDLTATAVHWQAWGRHMAVAAAYIGFYELCRYVSFPQWMLMSGFRLTCLLLLPPRYWPAIVLGEALPLLENAVAWGPKFGIEWALLAAVPMALLWIPALKPLCARWPIHDAEGRPNMTAILMANLVTAIITAASTTVSLVLALRHNPGQWPDVVPGDYFFAYLLGAYLGALTLTPVVLALHERFRALRDAPLSVGSVWCSALLRDTLWWVLPALAMLAWVAVLTPNDELRTAARLAMLWPVFGLAWRHGWHGTAVGGMAASVALAMTAKDFLDPQMIRVQLVLAIALSGSLLWGARNKGARAVLPERL
ncbi:MASE1 domain-containing protein [Luteibacter sp. dw_328]|uniref:MASE1 domain-containing protein n=1 Tax=Luteibacter sp. dw_328 TaxID=2719796 RepID=UPI001BD6AC15|nr:MASE1 domain-containing protein [Luteibacter sp. dw_328]